jgi:hypothetical protein
MSSDSLTLFDVQQLLDIIGSMVMTPLPAAAEVFEAYRTSTMSDLEAKLDKVKQCNEELRFGKYSGQTLKKVFANDPSYLDYLMRWPHLRDVTKAIIKEFLDDVASQGISVPKKQITRKRKKPEEPADAVEIVKEEPVDIPQEE